MGVKGLWQIISNSGKPIPLETLEHKILAIDVSIWLHQAVHGMRGLAGSSVANAHLLLLFHRICKLLFYGIKPVFIFDGGVPHLKKQTVAARRLKREIASKKTIKVRERLLSNLLKGQAVRNALGKKGRGPAEHHIIQIKKPINDMFELPPLPVETKFEEQISESGVRNEGDAIFTSLHDFDLQEETFKDLPLQIKHEIMCDLEVTRKENSWNSVNEMPQESNSFASYQMNRLLKRNQFQVDLDEVRSQIQKDHTAELEAQLFGELEEHVSLTHRIISEDAHSIIIKVKEPEEPAKLFTETKVVKKQKLLSKSDFLTELTKHGIVDQDKLNDSTDSDACDEEQSFYKKKKKVDQISFMKALDCVLDNGTELSQDEIYSLIQQSRQEVNDIPKKFDIYQPSTSKQSEMWQTNSSSSSDDDDDDFIEVPEPEDSPVKACEGNQSSKTNVDAIRQSKSNSLLMKIMQQKLDDLEAGSTSFREGSSPRKSEDSRRMEISFDINSCKPADDIFSDIFSKSKPIVPTEEIEKNKSLHKSSLESQYINSSKELHFDQKHETTKNKFNEKSTSSTMKNTLSHNLPEMLDHCTIPKFATDGNDICADIPPRVSNCLSTFSEVSEKYLVPKSNLDSSPDENELNTGLRNINAKSAIHESNYTINITDETVSGVVPSIANKNICVTTDRTIEESATNHNNMSNKSSDSTSSSLSIVNNSQSEIRQTFPKPEIPPKYTSDDLIILERSLETEQSSLMSQMQSLDRVASSISEQKFREAQELLQLFGIPYLVAPMEAEAQCAFLNRINLTHGTITDDSDVFLFGAHFVYKNFFNQARHVELFDSANIHRLYGLSRTKMIQLALLTGSDYTVGIESVGAVMAMELLSDYPSEGMDGLVKLKKNWLSLKNELSTSGSRQKLSNLHFPESFPNKEIYNAYLKPEVDTSDDKFSWGLPNVEALTKFTADKFGWNVSKTSEILIPVLKKIDNKTTQRRLDSYFSHVTLTKAPEIKSKRLLQAIKMSTTEQGFAELERSEVTPPKRKTILIPDPPRPNDPTLKRKHSRDTAPVKKSKGDGGRPKIEDDTPVVKPLTKEEKKQRNFRSLLQKSKIPQVEKEKKEKAEKLKNALNVLRKRS